MDRRAFMAAFGTVSLGGCLGPFTSEDRPQPGDVTCADGLSTGSSNGPGDGSWPTVLHDNRNTGQTAAPGPSGCVETRWTMEQIPQAGLSAGPVVADRSVYMPDQIIDDTRFVVYDAKTGEQHWQYTNHRQQFVPWKTPTLVGDILYIVSDHAIDAVDLRDRSTLWHREFYDKLPEVGLTPPRVANGLLYVGTNSGTVLAFDARTGEPRWTFDTDGLVDSKYPNVRDYVITEANERGAVTVPVAATAERVFVGSWDMTLYALDAATGDPEWRFSPGVGQLHRLHAPVVVDGTVYTQTESAILYVLDAATGDHLWTYDAYEGATDGVSPIVDEESVYIVAGTSTENLFLVALDRADGSTRWERQIGPTFVNPVADADTIYIDYGRGVHAIEKATGDRKWTLMIRGELAAPPAVVDDAVFVTDNEHVYGIW